MQEFLNVVYGIIEGSEQITNFMVTPIEINTLIFDIHLFTITPIGLIGISGLLFLFTYYLIRGLVF